MSVEIVGVDLVGIFDSLDSSLTCLRLEQASLSRWRPVGSFDLITCVHGLHYIGDKIGLIDRAGSWLVEGGLFVANLDLDNVYVTNEDRKRRLVKRLRNSGLEWDWRKRRIVCDGPRGAQNITWRYLGADDQVAPNYTGKSAVSSHYEYVLGDH